jgi:3-hydroxyethyl bacteriochlorophyllide a dehydrogenase
MNATAVVLHEPEKIGLRPVELSAPGEADVIVDVAWSGISTGTEKLLYTGRMPTFPGMGYPLVPGYESVGRVTEAGPAAGIRPGTLVFVPGSRGFRDVRGLFGGAASRIVTPAARALPVDESLGERAVLLALAATARHALAGSPPDLIVGHGVLGRLLARLALLSDGPPPVVWERDPRRASGAAGYSVVDPATDPRRDYRTIVDVSGNAEILDTLVERLAPGGEIVLAGFYAGRLSFAFPAAFMREARFRVAAEWREADLAAVRDLAGSGRLSLDGLVTHKAVAADAPAAYAQAFGDPACLKMILEWGGH